MSQLSLKALMQGRVEAVPPPPLRRPVGRPRLRLEVSALPPPAPSDADEIKVGADELVALAPSLSGPLRNWSTGPLRLLREVCRNLGENLEAFGPPGARTREDWSVKDRVSFCQWFRERERKVENPKDLLELASRLLSRPVRKLLAVLESEDELRAELKRRGFTPEGNLSRSASHLVRYMRPGGGRSQAMRRAGAGRRSEMSFLYPVVKNYFEDCRDAGVSVYPADLEARLTQAAEVWLRKAEEQLSSGLALSRQDEHRLKFVRERLASLPALSKNARRWMRNALQRFCEARVRKPQRLVQLTLSQEKMRCLVSWRSFDELLFLAMGHDESFLQERLVNPAEWLSNIEDTCILMSDQVPFWVKVSGGRALYSASELSSRKRDKSWEELRERTTQVVEVNEPQSTPMLRQSAIAEHSRYRVTLELTQCLSKWFPCTLR